MGFCHAMPEESNIQKLLNTAGLIMIQLNAYVVPPLQDTVNWLYMLH